MACTSSTTRSLNGVAISCSRPRCATPPLTTSTSVARPARGPAASTAACWPATAIIRASAASSRSTSGAARRRAPTRAQSLGLADRDALGPDRVDGVRPLLGDAAVAQARDGGEPGEGGVDEQLGPDLAAQVVGHADVADRLEQRASARVRSRSAPSSSPTNRRDRVAHDAARPEVGPAPLDDAREQVAGADDLGHPVLDQPVAERDERVDPAARDERLQRGPVERRLDRDQREVELAVELVGGGRPPRAGRCARRPPLVDRPGSRSRATCSSFVSSTTTRRRRRAWRR